MIFNSLKLEIVTPEKTLFNDSVEIVVVPTQTGEIGILPNHIPLFSRIVPGEIKIRQDGKEKMIAVFGGFVEVANGKAKILADFAVYSDEINEQKVLEAKKRAEEEIKLKKSDVDFALAEKELRKSILQLKVAERKKRHL